MKRLLFYGAIVTAALLLVFAVWLSGRWVLGTGEGARWLLESVSRYTPLKISAHRIEGSLLKGLRLEGLHLVIDDLDADVNRLDCRLQPARLLSGAVVIDEVAIHELRVHDRGQVSDLRWPKVSGIASLVDVRIKRLAIDDISYLATRKGGTQPTHLAFDGSVLWRHSRLLIKDFRFRTPYGTARGELEAGFYQPSLRFTIDALPQRTYLKMDTFSLQGTFRPGKSPEQLVGKIAAAGLTRSAKRLELTGEVGITAKGFNLRDFCILKGKDTLAGLNGSVALTSGEPELRLKLTLNHLNLQEETGIPTNIGGSLTVYGTPSRWHGSFAINNKGEGWRKVGLVGDYLGDVKGLKITSATASFCEGTMDVSGRMRWGKGVVLESVLRGSNFNPVCFRPEWKGRVNFDLAGNLEWKDGAVKKGSLRGKLKESSLYGRLLTGEIAASLDSGNLRFERLALKGRGFAITGAGMFSQGLHFSAAADDLGTLFPDAAGRLDLSGDVRLREKVFSVTARGKAEGISWKNFRAGRLSFDCSVGNAKNQPLSVHAEAGHIVYDNVRIGQGALKVTGTLPNHRIEASLTIGKTRVQGFLAGGWSDSLWRGTIESLSGRDAIAPWRLLDAAPLAVGTHRFIAGPLVLTGQNGERLNFNAGMGQQDAGGVFEADYRNINAQRFRDLFPEEVGYKGILSGKMTGDFSFDGHLHLEGEASCGGGEVRWQKEGNGVDFQIPRIDSSWSLRKGPGMSTFLKLNAKANGNGTVTAREARVKFKEVTLSLEGDDKGTSLSANLHPEGGGLMVVGVSSPKPLNAAPGEDANIKAQWEDIDARFFSYLIPENIAVAGRLSGRATGLVSAGSRFSLGGNLSLMPPSGVSEGKVSLKRETGETTAGFQRVSLTWNWTGSNLTGSISAGLVEQGRIGGTFCLPVAARFPVVLDKKGPLDVSLTGKFRENGLLGVAFPGMIRESHADIDVMLSIGGIWEKPHSRGRVRLARAGAYLPSAGIEIRDVTLAAEIEDDVVRIGSLQAKSGTGLINGKGDLKISGGRVVGCNGVLQGTDFQLLHTPELLVTAAPNLTFSGSPQKPVIRGEIKLQKLLVYGPPSGNFSTPSPDVVREGNGNIKIISPKFDARVRLTLGEHAVVRMGGVDARLAGSIDLNMKSFDEITSTGEIRVVEGAYRAYGVSLQITRGRLFYSGGAINDPSLDILALRTVGEVKAGISIGGRLSTPVTKLYSDPALSDVDIISYIVFGHALSTRTSAEQIGVLAQTAGLLLSRGKASSFQEKLKETFGLSTLEIQTENSAHTGRTGYLKKTGGLSNYQTMSDQTRDISDTLVSVGKYLTPQLYLGYGRSLFTGSNIFRLRYDINKKWQIETSTGTESGVDLYYRIYFK